MLKRILYTKLLDWRNKSQGETALLIDGAYCMGKTTFVSIFPKKHIIAMFRLIW